MLQIFLTILATLVIAGTFFLLFNRNFYSWLRNEIQRKGLHSSRRTLEDVKHLLAKGERDMAIRTYSQMYKLSLRQAELEVDLLERNLQKKL